MSKQRDDSTTAVTKKRKTLPKRRGRAEVEPKSTMKTAVGDEARRGEASAQSRN